MVSLEICAVLTAIFFAGSEWYTWLRKKEVHRFAGRAVVWTGIAAALGLLATTVQLYADPGHLALRRGQTVFAFLLTAMAAEILLQRLVFHVPKGTEDKNNSRNINKYRKPKCSEAECSEAECGKTGSVWSHADSLAVVLLTAGCAVLIFWQLGSRQAPQSFVTLREQPYQIIDAADRKTPQELSGENEFDGILLDLGQEEKLGSLYLYLGDTDHCILTVSAYDSGQNSWKILEGAIELNANYNWNRIPLAGEARYLRLMERTKDAVYGELVIQNAQGKVLTPVNKAVYTALFDEQSEFPAFSTYMVKPVFDESYYNSSEH